MQPLPYREKHAQPKFLTDDSSRIRRQSISLSSIEHVSEPKSESFRKSNQFYRQVSAECESVTLGRISTTPTSVFRTKLKNFRRQIRRHMIDSVNLPNHCACLLPMSAIGDIYFSESETASFTCSNRIARLGNQSLEFLNNGLQDNASYQLTPKQLSTQSDQFLHYSICRPIDCSMFPNTSPEWNRTAGEKPSIRKSQKTRKRLGPREVSFDESGHTWEIYGAEQDPNALGQAIECHLEKMMLNNQRSQRCASADIGQLQETRPFDHTDAPNLTSKVKQARFRRRSVSTATSTNEAPTGASIFTVSLADADEVRPRSRSKIIGYFSRVLRRQSTSNSDSQSSKKLHQQNSVVKCQSETMKNTFLDGSVVTAK